MSDLLVSAWQSVVRHRLRSLLAMAGVAIGVCALTSIMSVEQAWRKVIAGFFGQMDLETVQVTMPDPSLFLWRENGFRRPSLDASDLTAIRQACPAIASATLIEWGTRRATTEQGAGQDMSVRAVEADFSQTLPDEVKEGRLLTAEDDSRHAPVCLLTAAAQSALLGPGPALGREVRLNGLPFHVVGVIGGLRHPQLDPVSAYVPSTWTRAVLRSDRRRIGGRRSSHVPRIRELRAAR